MTDFRDRLKITEDRPEGRCPVSLRPLTEREAKLLRSIIAARVTVARNELGLSQRALSRAFGMSGSWIRKVEGANQWPPSWLLAALSEATGRPVGWFYGEHLPRLPKGGTLDEAQGSTVSRDSRGRR